VPIDDPVKLSRLIIENISGKPRKLSITAYLEWVLGVRREASAPYIITEQDEQTKAIFARNPWGEEFANRTAFADLMVQWQAGKVIRFTCDRTEFIGRHGSLEHPAALQASGKLSGRSGAGFDPCAALQTSIDLGIGESIEVVFVLGETQSRAAAISLIEQYRRSDIGALLELVKRHWQQTLELVQVSTPDHAMNLMLNRWLPYQTLSSRIYARTGFYQAGGAFGFRDQLQDTAALVGIKPDLARAQIVRAASRQFLEGDVQHWWHPPSGRGVRTRISDDLIWLPYAISHYLEVTGDTALLDETVNFIEGERLLPGHEDSYFTPAISSLMATIFEHGARALDYSLSLGVHGLPLIGSGDWNDGMNRVGREGKGESVWLAWFLIPNLEAWAHLAETRGETDRARVWREHASKLKTSLEAQAWDGAWYKRAFYDDGTPLGSSINSECQIDSIAQSWAVISGAGDPTRAAQAMKSVEKHLIKTEPGMVLLFDPPFENTEHDPGYIKGYLPGVRENGGQYTHAAVWSVIAFAMLGKGNKAFEVFSMLNPINHNHTRSDVERYKVEPYVLAADVYGKEPNLGRGGWTWYTGSSGWMYRAGLESILGFLRRGNTVTIKPCIPENWSEYQINIMFGSARFEIKIQNPQHVSSGVKLLELDGKVQPGSSFGLIDDGLTHQVRVVLGN
jgi:cyclic beta-1,2-glucan synthetase